MFVDNIRSFLSVYVVVFHVCLIYGSRQGWYYYEPSNDAFIKGFFNVFLILSRSFGLEVFFFISGYFIPGSYDRSGPQAFMKDRLIRFGIPIALLGTVLKPTLQCLVPTVYPPPTILENILSFDEFSPGPLWFVEILLILSAFYLIFRVISGKIGHNHSHSFQIPGIGMTIIICLAVALVSFSVRQIYPIGTKLFHFRVASFPAHIASFVLGCIAYRGDWLTKIDTSLVRKWTGVFVLSLIVFVPILIYDGAIKGGIAFFNGGPHWHAFLQALWEPFYVMGITVIIIDVFKKRFNTGSKVWRAMAGDSYAVFVIHAPIVTLLAYSMRDITLYPLAKCALVSVLGVLLCFFTSHYLVRPLPYVKRIL